MTTEVERAKTKLQSKMALLMVSIQIITAAVVLFTVGYIYQFTLISSNAQALQKSLEMAVLKIDASQIAKYDKTEKKDNDYQELYYYLSDIRTLDKMNRICIITDGGDQYKYIAEGGLERDNRTAQKELGITVSKDLYRYEVQKVFDEGTALHTEVYLSKSDQEVISAIAPIKDYRGRVIAVLYADMLKEAVLDAGWAKLYTILPYVVGAVLVTCLLIALIFALYIHFEVILPIRTVSGLAQELSAGKLDRQMPKEILQRTDELGILARSCSNMAKNVQSLTGEIDSLIEFALNENFEKRADSKNLQGEYKKIIENLNELLKLIVNKTIFYETLLDAVSMPVLAISKERKWSYINKAGADALQIRQKDVIGMSCNNLGASYCGTEDCVICRMEESGLDFVRAPNFELNGRVFRLKASKVYDKDGRLFCYLETAEDITTEVRLEEYQQREIQNVSEGLARLAGGNLDVVLEEADFHDDGNDPHIQNARKNFALIREHINKAVGACRIYLTDISQKLTAMAYGDMDQEMTLEYRGDFAQVKDSLNIIIEKFNNVINEINSSAKQVRMASSNVSEGSQSLAQATSEQVAASEEISATVEMLAGKARENASNARKANSFVEKARASSKEGAEKMQEMIQAITEINQASGDISRIIKTIEDIAFQTNILALNAAVEAARAGQYGKGFSVVASEVRSLASKSARAAKDTGDLIEGTVKKTGKGVAIAKEAVEAFDQIMISILQASGVVNGISEATNDQAISIAQISQGVDHISEVALNNSNTALESASASQELHTQADSLQNMICLFKLKKSGLIKEQEQSFQANQHAPEGLGKADDRQDEEKYSGKKFEFRDSDFF